MKTVRLHSGTGFDTSNNARIYLLQANKKFKLALKASTDYAHIRYSTDDGKAWTALPQGGGSTETITVSPSSNVAKVTIQILDDKTYADNLAADKSGFAEGETTSYVVWVESVNANTETAEILTAECEDEIGIRNLTAISIVILLQFRRKQQRKI